jgi:hypothetical protein
VNTPPVNTPPVNTPPVNTPPVNTPDPMLHAAPTGADDATGAQFVRLGSAWVLGALQPTVLGLSLLPGTALSPSTQGGSVPALAQASQPRPSPGAPGLPTAPGGLSGNGTAAPGGISLSFLAVLMALAGLAALLFERLTLAPAAWRSVARIALLERPG